MAKIAFATLKQARKGLKLPGGQSAEIYVNHLGEETYGWDKRGGYAEKVLEKLRLSLRKSRWTQSDRHGFGNPDGSRVGGTEYWTKGGWIVSITETYGGIKWDNWFDVSMSKVKVAV